MSEPIAHAPTNCDPTMSPLRRFISDVAEYLGLVEEHRFRSYSDEEIARAFHETYERLAPDHGYQTRIESRTPWEYVPINNRELVVATVRALLKRGVVTAGVTDGGACVCGSAWRGGR